MRRRLIALPFLLACAGPTAERAPSASPSAPTPSIADAQPFGCTLANVDDGRVVWNAPDDPIQGYALEHQDARTWIRLPAELVGHAPGEGGHATLLTEQGPCTGSLGEAQLGTIFEGDVAVVGREIHECAVSDPFALLCPDPAAVPATLRFARFEPGEVVTVDAQTTDRILRSAYFARESFGQHLSESEHPGHTELVLGRTSPVTVGDDTLTFVELVRAWFAPGVDPETGCPAFETIHEAVWDGERVAEGSDFRGVLHDGTHTLALVQIDRGDGPAECEGANTCLQVALWTPGRVGSYVRRSVAVSDLGSGEASPWSELLLRGHRDGCELED